MTFFEIFLLAQSAPAPPQPRSPSIFDMLVPLVLMFVIMYVILIKPQQKKQKQQEEMIKKLKAGDRVVTSGGIYGRIAGVKDQSVIVKVADNVKIEVNRGNISEILSDSKDGQSDTKVEGKKLDKK